MRKQSCLKRSFRKLNPMFDEFFGESATHYHYGSNRGRRVRVILGFPDRHNGFFEIQLDEAMEKVLRPQKYDRFEIGSTALEVVRKLPRTETDRFTGIFRLAAVRARP